MFGGGGGGFGARNNTTGFGQSSTFGKPATSFSSPSFGTGTTSLFGQTTQASTGLFGTTPTASAFGQSSTTPSFGSAFGTNTGASLFGGQQNAAGTTGGLFGAQSTVGNVTTGGSLFGSSGNSAFGQPSNTSFGYGTAGSSSLFGQNQTAAQPGSVFGQSSTPSTALFGSSSGFGNTATGTVIKFNPVTGTDSMIKNGASQAISTKHYCITCMKEYEGKSLEELRYEDYLANRKGPQSGGLQPATGLFGGSGTSLFGSSTTPSTSSNLFGGAGFGQTSNVFGQSTATSGLFGKPASTTLFGATTTTQSTGFGGFGQSTGLFGSTTTPAKPVFGAAQTGTGLFGGNTSTTPGFGTQQTAFGGFGTQQPTQTGSLFQQNKFPSFGAQTTSPFSFGANTQSSTTSLFGAKPATTGFGITAATSAPAFGTSTFGSTNQPSLFGGGFNKPPTGTFSFGQTSTTGSTLGSSLFGNTAPKPAGGLFGNIGTSTGLFGSSGFGTGTSTFGSGTNTTFGGGGLGSFNTLGSFGSTPQQSGGSTFAEQLQSLSALPFGDVPLFKHILPTADKKTEHDISKSSIGTNKQGGISDSFRVSVSINNSIVKRRPLGAQDPSKKALFDSVDGAVSEKELFIPRESVRHLKIKFNSSNRQQGVDTTDNSGSILPNSPSVVENTNTSMFITGQHGLSRSNNDSILFGDGKSRIEALIPVAPRGNSTPLKSTKSGNLNKSLLNISASNDNTIHEFNPSPVVNVNDDEENVGINISNASAGSNNSSKQDTLDKTSHPTGIKLTRSDYYTVPSLDELTKCMDENGCCIVNNFTIGRHTYGNVTFLEPVDVAGLDLDDIVEFNHKEMTVYKDDENKPPIGTELNRKAQVTLDRIWPVDKTTRDLIKDPERIKQMNYELKLKRACSKMKSQFIEYRPITGSWVFEVDHFSKYGLLDEDDDDDVPEVKKQKYDEVKPKKSITPKNITPEKKSRGLGGGSKLDDDLLFPRESLFAMDEMDDDLMVGNVSLQKFPDLKCSLDGGYNEYERHIGSVLQRAKELDSSLKKVQLMKASFYVEDDIDNDTQLHSPLSKMMQDIEMKVDSRKDSVKVLKSHPSLFKSHLSTSITPQIHSSTILPSIPASPGISSKPKSTPKKDTGFKALTPVIYKPRRVALLYKNTAVPFMKSIVGNLTDNVHLDVALLVGQTFKVGWSKQLSFTCLSSEESIKMSSDSETEELCRLLKGRKLTDFSKNVIQVSKISVSSVDYFEKNVTDHLEVCLQESFCDDMVDECPRFVPKCNVNALHAHCELAQQIHETGDNYERQVWELMVALWGNIPNLTAEDNQRSHRTKMIRKNALSDWFENAVTPIAKSEINESDHISAIISLLTAHKIYEACKYAISGKDYNLALLISQIGSNEIVRSQMLRQLLQWYETEADILINKGRLKIMVLIAGQVFLQFHQGLINTCDYLDWKRAFAIHLWYINMPSDPLLEAISEYEKSYMGENKFASAPNPPYYTKFNVSYENQKGEKVYDLCYHLIKLYSSRSHPLEKLLNPVTHTINLLDYRLSWFVMITLKSLGYFHMSEDAEALTHVSFAAQLETTNMWHWAVFVLLHISDITKRTKAVIDMIQRNVQLLPDHSAILTSQELFLCQKLSIPINWIFCCKAIRASSENRYKEAAWYYIKAERWNEGHDIIMKHLIQSAIINDHYEEIEKLLGEIVSSEKVISGWIHRGGLIWDYLTVVKQINNLVSTEDPNVIYAMEQLQPIMASVCSNIKLMPSVTARDRLCQAEISKRMMQFVSVLNNIQKESAGISYKFIAALANKLPLPEDYVQQELQENISMWINK